MEANSCEYAQEQETILHQMTSFLNILADLSDLTFEAAAEVAFLQVHKNGGQYLKRASAGTIVGAVDDGTFDSSWKGQYTLGAGVAVSGLRVDLALSRLAVEKLGSGSSRTNSLIVSLGYGFK